MHKFASYSVSSPSKRRFDLPIVHIKTPFLLSPLLTSHVCMLPNEAHMLQFRFLAG